MEILKLKLEATQSETRWKQDKQDESDIIKSVDL